MLQLKRYPSGHPDGQHLFLIHIISFSHIHQFQAMVASLGHPRLWYLQQYRDKGICGVDEMAWKNFLGGCGGSQFSGGRDELLIPLAITRD